MTQQMLSLTLLLLSACVPEMRGSTYYDGRFWFSNVKSGSDIAGGPRQDLIIIVDRDGRIIETFNASGVGTLQAVASGLSAAVVAAAGQVGGSALIRPARNTTTVSMDVAGTGGAGGSGGVSSATSAGGSATGSTSSAVSR